MSFVDDFALFADGFDATILLKDKKFSLLILMELHIHEKLKGIAKIATQLLCKAAANKSWVSVEALASLAGRAQILHLAMPVAKFFLRELHDVPSSAKSMTGTVRLTRQLKWDLEWWRVVLSKHHGASI